MAEALGKRPRLALPGTRLAHLRPMTEILSDEARELLQNFEKLPADERARVLALVRGMSRVNQILRERMQRSAQLMPA
jgi:hypothetical protein